MRLSIVVPTKGDRSKDLECLRKSIVDHTTSYQLLEIVGNHYAKQLNEGASKATGDYITFLHDDCEVMPGWADELADCGAFCCGDFGNRKQLWGGYYDGTFPVWFSFSPKHPPLYAAWPVFSRTVLDSLLPFDEKYAKPDVFDTDLGFTIARKGLRWTCLPGKIIHWFGGGGPSTRVADQKIHDYLNQKWELKEKPYWWLDDATAG